MHVTKSEPLPRARFGGKGLLAKKTVKEEIGLADFVWRRDTELLGGQRKPSISGRHISGDQELFWRGIAGTFEIGKITESFTIFSYCSKHALGTSGIRK